MASLLSIAPAWKIPGSQQNRRPPPPQKPQAEIFFVVAFGKVPGIYRTFTAAKEQVQPGLPGKIHRFDNLYDAQRFMALQQQQQKEMPDARQTLLAAPAASAQRGSRPPLHSSSPAALSWQREKKYTQPPAHHLPPFALSTSKQQQPQQEETKLMPVPLFAPRNFSVPVFSELDYPIEENTVYIAGAPFVDRAGYTRMGVGVFFGPCDTRNISDRLCGNQSQEAAEVTAAIMALQEMKERPLTWRRVRDQKEQDYLKEVEEKRQWHLRCNSLFLDTWVEPYQRWITSNCTPAGGFQVSLVLQHHLSEASSSVLHSLIYLDDKAAERDRGMQAAIILAKAGAQEECLPWMTKQNRSSAYVPWVP
jgi:hypothetical protein